MLFKGNVLYSTLSVFQWKRKTAMIVLFEGSLEGHNEFVAQCSNIEALIGLCMGQQDDSSTSSYDEAHPYVVALNNILQCVALKVKSINLETSHANLWKHKLLNEATFNAVACLLWDLIIGLHSMFEYKHTYLCVPDKNSSHTWLETKLAHKVMLPFPHDCAATINPWEKKIMDASSSNVDENDAVMHHDYHTYQIQQNWYSDSSAKKNAGKKKSATATQKRKACHHGKNCQYYKTPNGCKFYHPDSDDEDDVASKKSRPSNSPRRGSPEAN